MNRRVWHSVADNPKNIPVGFNQGSFNYGRLTKEVKKWISALLILFIQTKGRIE